MLDLPAPAFVMFSCVYRVRSVLVRITEFASLGRSSSYRALTVRPRQTVNASGEILVRDKRLCMKFHGISDERLMISRTFRRVQKIIV